MCFVKYYFDYFRLVNINFFSILQLWNQSIQIHQHNTKNVWCQKLTADDIRSDRNNKKNGPIK